MKTFYIENYPFLSKIMNSRLRLIYMTLTSPHEAMYTSSILRPPSSLRTTEPWHICGKNYVGYADNKYDTVAC